MSASTLVSHAEQRRARRCRVTIDAKLRGAGAQPFRITLIDLSVSGFRAEGAFAVAVGQRMWVTLPGLAAIECRVQWRRAPRYGFSFQRPLHPAVLEHVVSAVQDGD